MKLNIWFNPDLSKYEFGSLDLFKRLRNASLNYGRFELVGSVPADNQRIAQRVADNLNIIRDPE